MADIEDDVDAMLVRGLLDTIQARFESYCAIYIGGRVCLRLNDFCYTPIGIQAYNIRSAYNRLSVCNRDAEYAFCLGGCYIFSLSMGFSVTNGRRLKFGGDRFANGDIFPRVMFKTKVGVWWHTVMVYAGEIANNMVCVFLR